MLFAVGHHRKINSNLSPAVFPQLLSERLRELVGGVKRRPARYQPPLLSRERSGGRASGGSFNKKGELKVEVQVVAVDGTLAASQTNNSAGVCWQKVEHLGRAEGNFKHGTAKLQLHDGNKRTPTEASLY